MQSQPSHLELWGLVQKEFGKLDQSVQGLERRQDDMRRELLGHVYRIEQKIDHKPEKPMRQLARLIPWDRVAFLALTTLGTMGWIKPTWVKVLTGG